MITEVPRAKAWTPPVGARPDYTHPLMRGLVGWWPLNDGAGMTVRDLSVNRKTGQYAGSTNGWITSDKGLVWDFELTSESGFNLGTNTFVTGSQNRTLTAWARAHTLLDNGRIFSMGTGTTGEKWDFRLDGADLRIEIQGSAYISSLSFASSEVWYFVACVLDGTTLGDHILYLDKSSDTAAGGSSVNTASDNARIGYSTGAGNDEWRGELRDVRLFNRALSPSEIGAIQDDPWAPFRRSRPVVFSAGGGGSIIPQIMHHRRMMGVS